MPYAGENGALGVVLIFGTILMCVQAPSPIAAIGLEAGEDKGAMVRLVGSHKPSNQSRIVYIADQGALSTVFSVRNYPNARTEAEVGSGPLH